MKASSKVLILVIALSAFTIGALVNSTKVEDEFDTATLLQAKLLTSDSASTVADQLGELTLVNFWASWCAPCREEMPIFETMYQRDQARGFKVIGIAIDSLEKAQPMLDSMAITYPILYAEQTGMELMSHVGNPQGLLPYSLLLDSKGRVIEQVLGRIHEQQIADWVSAHLASS